MQVPGITSFERRRQRLVSGHRFAGRMLKAIGLWCIIALVGLAIGMAGYCAFEGIEIAPEPAGHGLPLSKCEAYNRVYEQPCGSS